VTASTADPTARAAVNADRLSDEVGLARDALRRAGYLYPSDPDVPLAEAIDRLNTDAREAVRLLGSERRKYREALAELVRVSTDPRSWAEYTAALGNAIDALGQKEGS
jgi:hypothetical protein